MILDDDALQKSREDVSDTVLLDILQNQGHYPDYFIQKAQEALAFRNIQITGVSKKLERPVYSNSIRAFFRLPFSLLLLTLILILGIGYWEGAIIFTTIIVAFCYPHRPTQRRIWWKLNLILFVINLICIAMCYFWFSSMVSE